MKDRLIGLVQLIRPLNVVLLAAGTVLGGVLAGGAAAFQGGSLPRLLVAAASAALIGGAANSLNDACDLEIDRTNRPSRPLPAGRVTPRMAWIVWGAGTAAGLAVSARLAWPHVLMAVAAAGLLYVYNTRWKRVVGLGNIVVAFVVALALVYGGWAVGPAGAVLVGAAFAFLTTLTREIIKDVQDARGDAAAGARTLPLAWGEGAAWRSAAALVVLTIALTPVPFLVLDYPGVYLIGVGLADFALLRVLSITAAMPTPDQAAHASRLLKGAMALGMVALTTAGFVR